MKAMLFPNYVIVCLGAVGFLLGVTFNLSLLMLAGMVVAVAMLVMTFIGKRKLGSGDAFEMRLLRSHYSHLFRIQLVTLMIGVAGGVTAALFSQPLGLGSIMIALVWFLARALHGLGRLREGYPVGALVSDDT